MSAKFYAQYKIRNNTNGDLLSTNLNNPQFRNKHSILKISMENAIHIVAPLADKHTHTVILLHGRDSLAAEFAEEFFESQASDDRTLPEIFPTVKWVFPASQMRNSARFGEEMSQWFDIWSVEEPTEKEEIQLDGLRDSTKEILSIVHNEASLVPPSRIILGGISQGCATAIHALLRGKIRLGGFMGFCSWLPLPDKVAHLSKTFTRSDRLRHIDYILSEEAQKSASSLKHLAGDHGSALDTPIFLSHSEDDEVVPIKQGIELSNNLRDLGLQVTWKCYKTGGHWINEPEGVDDIVGFLVGKATLTS